MDKVHTDKGSSALGGVRFSRIRGFTLVELMVAVAIVAILAGIAIPFYSEFSTRGRRPDGTKLLLEASDRQEQYFFDHKTYTTSATDLGYPSATPNSENGFYSLGIQAGFLSADGTVNASGTGCTGIAQCFIATASRQGAQAGDGDCGNYRLDSRGRKWATGCAGKTGSALEKCLDRCW